MADPAALDPRIAGVLKRPFAQQVAFFRGKLGNLIPTQRWTDVQRSGHDRGFMVAGAQTADLLAALAAAVDRGATEGKSIDAFRKDFAAIVKQTGWSYTGEFNWRTRTIYRTNMATSYAAGRNAQLREGGFPYLMYKHGGSADPRPEHLAWDGIVLPADHPFWRTHFAPNGWGCSCRIVGLRSLDDARRLGGDPDKQLPEGWDSIDPKTGAPPGIDKGWDYRPGDTVVDAVAAMARKAEQWPESIRLAYIDSLPEDRRAELLRQLQSAVKGGGTSSYEPIDDFKLSPRDAAARRYVIEQGRMDGNEHGAALLPDGRARTFTSGLPRTLYLPDDVLALANRAGSNISLHHNHIDGNSFSAADIVQINGLVGIANLYAQGLGGQMYRISARARMTTERMATYLAGVKDALEYRLARLPAQDFPAWRLALAFDHLRAQVLARSGVVAYDAILGADMQQFMDAHKSTFVQLVSDVANEVKP